MHHPAIACLVSIVLGLSGMPHLARASALRLLFALLWAPACGSSNAGTSPAAHADPPPSTGPACNGAALSTLPGVSIEFPDDRCSFSAAEVAAGITIKYTVVVANTLSVSPVPLDAGHCDQPDPEFGLTPLAKLWGQNQQYCLCDVGGCFQEGAHDPTTVVPAGRYDRAMTWTGKNWNGPSDTGNQPGAAFPVGTYTFTVTAQGHWIAAADTPNDTPFTVTADRTITVTP